MALLQEVEPLFNGARIFGCTPHRITEKDMLVTKWGLVYSLIIALVFLYGCIAGVYLITVDVIEMKMLLLTAVRTIMSYVCFFTDAILTMIWNDKLRNVLANLHDFDVGTRFNQRINITVLYLSRVAFIMVVIFWCVVGYVSYSCEKSSPLFNGITYGIVNAAMSMQLLKFIGFLTLLYQRFAHLERLILPSGKKVASLNQYPHRTELHDIWWLHCRLITSAEEINSVYTTQLLFWITTMFLNALSRIYTLTGGDEEFNFLKIRESMSVSACVINLFIITVACHFTAAKGNRIGSLMFSPRSALLRKRCFVEQNERASWRHMDVIVFSFFGWSCNSFVKIFSLFAHIRLTSVRIGMPIAVLAALSAFWDRVHSVRQDTQKEST